VDRLTLEWVDIAAGYLRSGSWCSGTAPPAGLVTALTAISNANLAIATAGGAVIGVTPAGTGTYPLVTDTAVLNFLTTALTGVQLTIPSPVASIFGSDGVTVDPTNPLVGALVLAVTAFLTDGAGNAVATFNTGVKSSRRVEQNG